MATWNANFQTVPTGADTPTMGDDEVRNTRIAIEERMRNEHTTFTSDGTGGVTNADWLHKAGSGVAFYQASAPTTRTNGVASLIDGLLWYDTTNKMFKVRSGGSWIEALGFLMKTINMGDWNMDSTGSISVAHGCTWTKIIGFQFLIRDDGDTLRTFRGDGVWVDYIDMINVYLSRLAGGAFDNTSYDSTGYNRGWITILYTS
jgi:hypothetical protein